MAVTLPNGVVVPNEDGQEPISATGVQEMRTLGASVDSALASKASTSYVDAGDQAVTDHVDEVVMVRRHLNAATDIFTLDAGFYTILSASWADLMTNLPPGERRPATIRITKAPGYGWREIVYSPTGADIYWRATTSRLNQNEMGPWVQWGPNGRRGLLTTPTDIFELDEGFYTIPSATFGVQMTNLPEGKPGTIDVIRNAEFAHRRIEYNPIGEDYFWRTVTAFPDTSAMRPWVKFGASGGPVDSLQNPYVNEHRKQFFIRRRGGPIGIAGRGAVALRFDHGAANFQDVVLPMLEEFGFPSGFALNPSPERLTLPQNEGVTWDDYREWAASKGVEPWNHSMTHTSVSSLEDLKREIVDSRDLIAENIPGSAIEGWMPPGGSYDGQQQDDTPESFSEYPAGRIIMASHAVASGYNGSHIRPASGSLVDGHRHFTIDTSTSNSTITNLIEEAQDTEGAVQIMLHPSILGDEGYINESRLRSLFEWIAAERDANRLVVLSPAALMLADRAHGRRLNLARFGDFRPFGGRTWTDRWSNTTGWSRAEDGGISYVSTSTGGVLSQDLRQYVVDQHRGALFEVSALVRTPSSGVARIGSTSIPGALKDVTLTSSWRRVWQFVTMPLDAAGSSWNVSVGRVSGEVQVTDVRLQPA